ncbi:terminase large subunit [Mycolicibacterium peregrinum]|uniref:terminase large subunit n=1 Tax=Mycolicibacterium peregrinum TaxID=43304 RepID=UPI0009E9A674|nr:terminase TerL endonuclease subunit [Mycolicibacterium peregrinum]MCV7205297.1 terminase large subunit [Mycolicibacterium peregrinum]
MAARQTTTRSTGRAKRPRRSVAWQRADLDALKLSPEVAWYLESRGYKPPTCPPLIKTPEPGELVRGAVFDPERVDRVVAAFRRLRHTKGRFAGQPFDPDCWQVAYYLAPVFGWVAISKDTGEYARVVTTVWIELPRKNGKTQTASGTALYLTGADGEAGAQVVCAATNKDQAKFAFDPMKQVVQKSPGLAKHFDAWQSKIVHKASGSVFQPVANVGDAQHGADLHGGIVDEVHLHKTNDLIEAIETGTGSRIQPLVLFITTADAGRRHTPYDEKRSRIEKLARRALKDPTTYGVVFAATADDDPFAESTWKKANPGYGISPTKRFMKSAATKAKDSPAELASFQRLHLGLRTKQQFKYLELAPWDRNASIVDVIRLKGRECFGGLDLGSTSDLTALCWVFPDGDAFDVLLRCWAPEESIEYLDERTARAASTWVKQGWLVTTPGNVTDYDFIKAQIGRDRDEFLVSEIAYDRWNATQLVNDLTSEGAPMISMGQGFVGMSAPTKDLQRLVLLGTEEKPVIRHGGNPLMRWMVDNFAVAMDPAGNVKPDKANAGDKIDGVVALIMALSRALAAKEAEGRSAYENYDLAIL